MFKLLRYFSIMSLITIALGTILLGVFYRHLALNDLIELGERNNVALTQSFANSLGPDFVPFLVSISGLSGDELRAHPEIVKVHQAALAQMKGLSVVKIKLYNLTGLTVFSTEAKQIGEDQSTNAGFLAARAGKVASKLVHRDTFNAFDQVIEDRDLLQTYMPFFRSSTSPIEGVFELYADMTTFLQKIHHTQRIVILGVVLILTLLYSVLFFIVRHADGIIKHQYTALAAANQELEAFSSSVSHDLRAPLRSIDGFSRILLKNYHDKLDTQGQDYLQRVRAASQRMGQLIDDLLELSRVIRTELHREAVDLSALGRTIAAELQQTQPERQVTFVIAEGLVARGDARLLRVVLENLLNNAWKFTGKLTHAEIVFGSTQQEGSPVYCVRDNGAGFDMAYANKLFGVFQRLHAMSEFEGTGLGLATVQRIIHRHGGRVWAEGAVDQGATFYFTL